MEILAVSDFPDNALRSSLSTSSYLPGSEGQPWAGTSEAEQS